MNPPPDPVVKDEANRWRNIIGGMTRRPFHESNRRQKRKAANLLYAHIKRELGL